MDVERSFSDLTEIFEFENESLDYIDGPVSGWIREKESGIWYAFECQPIVATLLWHWTLVPARKEGEAAIAMTTAAASSAGSWLSILEDRRGRKESLSRLVRIENKTAKPVMRAAPHRKRP